MVVHRRQRLREGSVPAHNTPIDTALDAFRTVFGAVDVLRRIQGDAIASFGLGPSECAYRVVASAPYWRLRDYGGQETSRSLFIVAAPIKRPYIWDLAPSVSAIRYCLRAGLHVYLLEWLPASRHTSNNGLTECALAISECAEKIAVEGGDFKAVSDGSFAWWHASRHLWRHCTCDDPRSRAPRSATMLPAGTKSVQGCTRFLTTADMVRCRSIARFAPSSNECVGIAWHVHLVEADRRSAKSHRSSGIGNAWAH